MPRKKEMTIVTAMTMSVGIAVACCACVAVLFVVWYWTIGAVHPNWNNFLVVTERMNIARVLLGAFLIPFVLLLPYMLTMVYAQKSRID